MDWHLLFIALAVGVTLVGILYGAAIARTARDEIQRPMLPVNDDAPTDNRTKVLQ